ncbi:MAG: hypothetical protein SFU83_05895 [Meiothermus sp.]|nr:hypothetical protein [Meiothermus sp.]
MHGITARGLAALALAGSGLAQDSLVNDAYAAQVQAAVAKVWPRMERIWPGTPFGEMYLLLTNGRDYWVISSGGLEKRPYLEAPERIRVGLDSAFAAATYRGHPAIAIRQVDVLPNGAVPSVFGFATHEAFHLHVQTGWPVRPSGGNGQRALDYPINATPRLYRRLIFEGLLAGLRGEGLGAARYWLERWKREFPAEAQRIRFADTVEGTAEYAETLAYVYAALGPNPSPEEVRRETLEYVRTTLDRRDRFAALDSESYPLGALAGLLLDALRPEWKGALAKDPQPPAEMLLGGVEEVQQFLPQSHWLLSLMALTQRRYAGVMEPFLNAWRDPARVLVALPAGFKGTIVLNGFVSTAALEGTVMMGLSAQLEWPRGRATLAGLTLSQGPAPPCGAGSQFLVFPLQSLEYTLSGEIVRVEQAGLRAEFAAVLTEHAGRRYLCAR